VGVSQDRAPYHLLGLISMTPALWVFLVVQLVIVIFAGALSFVSAKTDRAARRLVMGHKVAFIMSLGASALTVVAGFVEAYAADGPPSQKAAQLASGLLTVMNGTLMAIFFAAVTGGLLSSRAALLRSRT
jgi:hypothetical protein